MAHQDISKTSDIVIIGGAMMGTAVAWHLVRKEGFTGKISVIEKDPSYEFSATARTNSCIRQQFSNALNIQISQFGAEVIKNFPQYCETEEAPEIHFNPYGYIYLAADQESAEKLKEAQKIQENHGAGTLLLDPERVRARYPFYDLSDICLASHNTKDEGLFDGASIFDFWRRDAQKAGVRYIHDEVIAVTTKACRVEHVVLAKNGVLSCGAVLNAAGTNARAIAHMADLDLPIEPRKRMTYIFDAESSLPCDLPLTIDPSGVHCRSEGAYYLAGSAPLSDPAVAQTDFHEPSDLWEEHVWPILARRIPSFDRLKVMNSWAGHYDFNTFDQNALLGRFTPYENVFNANGFSGHGLQQASAIGRGLAELIIHGSYQSLDLSPLSVNRVLENKPFIEKAII